MLACPQNDNNSAENEAKIKAQQKDSLKCKRSPFSKLFIHNPAEIAVFFADVVTTPSDLPNDWVARNGDISIFSAFQSVLPEVITYLRH
jgi:hypothetical protein